MDIVFRKLPTARHEILVHGRRGPDIRLPAQPTGPTMPHDLVHAAVEQILGLTDGFWGAIAQGAMFDGFESITPGRHRHSGLKVLRRKGDAVMAAELAVNWAYRVWSGLPTEGRGIGAPRSMRLPAPAPAPPSTRPLPAGRRWMWAAP